MVRQAKENSFSDQDYGGYDFPAFFKKVVSNAPKAFQLVLLRVVL